MKSFFIGLTIILCFLANRANSSLSDLLNNPEKALVTARTANYEFEAAYALMGIKNRCEINEAFAEAKEPFFLLDECNKKNCPLLRTHHPQWRKTFEETVANALNPTTANPVEYVEVGAGKLFSTLVIIARFLSKHEDATINVRLIDSKFSILSNSLATLVQSNKYHDEASFIKNKVLKMQQRIANFENYLKCTFKNAKIQVFLYESVSRYIYELTHKKIPAATVVCAADLSHDNNATTSKVDYQLLCLSALIRNSECKNMLLLKPSQQETAIIVSMQEDKNKRLQWKPLIFLKTENDLITICKVS